MTFKERSYSGKVFRPRPEILVEADGQLVIIATPWGPRSSAKKVIQVIQDFLHSVQHDAEATSPFAMLTCLSPKANYLRIAIKLANDLIYNEDNKNEYTSGVELFVMIREPNELIWTQVGYPFALLDRSQRPLVSLGAQHDLVVEYSKFQTSMPPLPQKLLGLDPSSDFSVESLHPLPQDRVILLARSGLPANIHTLSSEKRDLESVSQVLAKDDADLPYWLGIIDFTAA